MPYWKVFVCVPVLPQTRPLSNSYLGGNRCYLSTWHCHWETLGWNFGLLLSTWPNSSGCGFKHLRLTPEVTISLFLHPSLLFPSSQLCLSDKYWQVTPFKIQVWAFLHYALTEGGFIYVSSVIFGSESSIVHFLIQLTVNLIKHLCCQKNFDYDCRGKTEVMYTTRKVTTNEY